MLLRPGKKYPLRSTIKRHHHLLDENGTMNILAIIAVKIYTILIFIVLIHNFHIDR